MMWSASFWLDGELMASFGASESMAVDFWRWVQMVLEKSPPGTECRVTLER